MEIGGNILLDPQIVRFAFVLGQETWDGFGVAHDRAGDEIPLLAQRDTAASDEEVPNRRTKAPPGS